MKIDQNIFKYLKGDLFTNSLRIDLDRTRYESLTREEIITQIIKGKDVIHIGCSDHIPVIKQKIAVNRWLHKLISENSSSCLGIDIDRESIDYVRNELGFENIICGNILTDNLEVITSKKWDYVVFGEIIEHIGNPVEFLKTFRERFGKNISRFVISVPDIYNKKNLANMLSFREEINSDHRFWFTPYTISKILVDSGYIPESITFGNLIPLSKKELALRKLRKMTGMKVASPFYYFSSIIAIGEIQNRIS